MTIDIEKLFNASPRSVYNLLGEANVGYYIPAYQRPYAWKPNPDIAEFMQSLLEPLIDTNTKAFPSTFIGTITLFDDHAKKGIEPQMKGQLPAKVMHVIDGQQRLTTLLLICKVLVQQIKEMISRLSKHKESKSDEVIALASQLEDTKNLLLGMVGIAKRPTQGDGFGMYPRMIRQLDDSWSYSSMSAQYKSPIARCLSELLHSTSGQSSESTSSGHADEDGDNEFQTILQAEKEIKARLTKATSASSKAEKRVSVEAPAVGAALPERSAAMLEQLVPDANLRTPILGWMNDDEEKVLGNAARVLLAANYIIHMVALIQVTCDDEDYAFDIFESLNTKGEPLTSIETFKPRVVRLSEIEKFRISKENTHFERILAAVAGLPNRDHSAQVVTSFALVFNGVKLSKKIRQQRRWLGDSFDSWRIAGRKPHEFLEALAITAELQRVFSTKNFQNNRLANVSPSVTLTDEAKECLQFLVSANNKIAIAHFAAVLYLLRNKPEDVRNTIFSSVACALAAFFAMWRSSSRGTSGIDTAYRTISQQTLNVLVHSDFSLPAYLEAVRKQLVEGHLATSAVGHGGLDGWPLSVVGIPVYDESVETANFLLRIALDTNGTAAIAGAATAARPGGELGLLCMSDSIKKMDLTVEHIRPATPKAGDWTWTETPGEPIANLVDSLGNLTLLPRALNSSVSNRSRRHKVDIYTAASSASWSDLETILAELKETTTTRKETLDAVSRYPATVWLKPALEVLRETWEPETVKSRTEALASAALPTLRRWLGA
jgi:hypothetical protein